MKTLNLEESLPFAFEKNNFFLLGNLEAGKLAANDEDAIKIKFKNKNNTDISIGDMWATLGWADPEFKSKLKGNLEFSINGNVESKPYLKPLFDEIKYINPAIEGQSRPVTERFINFKKVKFDWNPESFSIEEIPELRITVYLKKGEAAMVCYQHGNLDEDDDSEAEFEFIQPQNYSANRDRLDFIFPILPEYELESFESNGKTRFRFLNGRKRKTSFLMKIFTFQTVPGSEDEVYKSYTKHINAKGADENLGFLLFGKDKYSLVNYDKSHRDFVGTDALPIDFSKKTLMLINGTFMNTDITFSNLIQPTQNFQNSLLNQLLEDGVFEQIIGFNYPTISHDAKDNALNLYDMLKGKRFEQPVSMVGSSRGCLLAKYLTCDEANIYFDTDKVIMFSAANGVGYFNFAKKYISRYLSIQRQMSGPAGKIIFGFLHLSAEYFLKQPGAQLMTLKNERLTGLLEMKPINANTEYYNVVSDWNPSLAKSPFKKITGTGLDLLIKGILGKEHDWVVGCNEQSLYFNQPFKYVTPLRITSMHARYFDVGYTPHDTHKEIYDYFDKKKAIA